MDNLKLKEISQNPWDSFQAKTKTNNLILDKTIDIKNFDTNTPYFVNIYDHATGVKREDKEEYYRQEVAPETEIELEQ